MTNAISSSELCFVCRSSSSSSCGCNLTYRGMRTMLNISDQINPVISLPPASQVQTTLHEFQILPNESTVGLLFSDINVNESRPEQMPLTEPTLQYAEHPSNYHNPHRLNLNFCSSSTASSVGTPPESLFDVTVMGRAEPTATAVSFAGGMLNNTSTASNKEIGNASGSNEVDPVMEREARVMRYKEKRKNRKFVKQIRYATRQAYAEKRPRIKGRFAKRLESGQPVAPPHFSTDFLGMGWFHR